MIGEQTPSPVIRFKGPENRFEHNVIIIWEYTKAAFENNPIKTRSTAVTIINWIHDPLVIVNTNKSWPDRHTQILITPKRYIRKNVNKY